MNKSMVVVLALVGILGASTAEATPITAGFYFTTNFIQKGGFSGADVAVSDLSIGGGVGTTINPGRLDVNFGLRTTFSAEHFTVQIGSDSCIGNGGPTPTCGARLTFTFAPNLDPPGPEPVVIDVPFTMTGLLTVGAVTRPIDGSGTMHAQLTGLTSDSSVRFNFAGAVPEPSSVVLMLVGFTAVIGWSRRCGVLG